MGIRHMIVGWIQSEEPLHLATGPLAQFSQVMAEALSHIGDSLSLEKGGEPLLGKGQAVQALFSPESLNL